MHVCAEILHVVTFIAEVQISLSAALFCANILKQYCDLKYCRGSSRLRIHLHICEIV